MEFTVNAANKFHATALTTSHSFEDLNSIALQSFSKNDSEDELTYSHNNIYKRKPTIVGELDNEDTRTDSGHSDEDELTHGTSEVYDNPEEAELVKPSKKNKILFAIRYIKRPWAFIFSLITIILLCITTIVLSYMEPASGQQANYQNGIVSSNSEACSKIGSDILMKGGNAVDAAVATTFCLGVTNPFHSGIGGGGYMVFYMAQNGSTNTIDFRETAPKASKVDMFNDDPTQQEAGALSIAVPGELAGLQLAHRYVVLDMSLRQSSQYGVLPWEYVVLPSANLAKNGFVCDQNLANEIQYIQSANITNIFAPDGFAILEGQIIRNQKLGDTLLTIAQNGTKSFYQGKLGEALITDLRNVGSIVTEEDLNDYTAQLHPIQRFFYHGIEVLTASLSSAGGIGITEILNILERYNLPAQGFSPTALHLTIESFKHTFADIWVLGDQDFVNSSRTIVPLLSTKEYASDIRKKISSTRTFPPDHYGIVGAPLKGGGSSSVCVVDKDRNAVALTSTLNSPLGSHVFSHSLGILLNNQMASFTTEVVGLNDTRSISELSSFNTINNFIEPGKRPLSSITPTILLIDGEVYLVIAASSGDVTGQAAITAVVHTILDIVGYGFEPSSSVSKARCHHQLIPDQVFVEYNYPSALIEFLEQLGHEVVELGSDVTLGNVQVILNSGNGWLTGATETGGQPAGVLYAAPLAELIDISDDILQSSPATVKSRL